MGFTIEDMLLISADRYRMQLAAGKNGWSNSIGWLLMLEDRTIIRNFSGLELAVTTGLGFQRTEDLISLVQDLVDKHASGLIINTGYYIKDIPSEVCAYCDENDFPLLTVPWDIYLAEMIKDLSIRVYLQSSTDEQLTESFIHAIEQPDAKELYVKNLLPYFDVDGTFQVVLFTLPGLDQMDTVERKRLSYRMMIYLSDITHNGHFFYYDSMFVLIINALSEQYVSEIVRKFKAHFKRRMHGSSITIGIGSQMNDISNLHCAFRRAKAALSMALDTKSAAVYFDQMETYRLLYSISDTALLKEMCEIPLKPLLDHDRKHNSCYTDTLEAYLQYDGSIQAVANAMCTHRNTIIYRMNNIRELLNCPLQTRDEKMPYQIAVLIRHMNLNEKENQYLSS